MRTPRLDLALATALLVSGAARAGDLAEPLTVRAEPAQLDVGTRARASVVVEGTDEPPRVASSAGRVERIRRAGARRWVADLLPPPEGYPRIAIVSARAGGRHAWTAVPLVGRGIAVAHSTPGAAIRVTIGDREFGPVRADAAGAAHVPVIVPPGVVHAYHRGKPLDLRIPATLHVHAVTERETAPADEAVEIPILLFAVAPDGTPRPGAPIAIAVTHGEVGAPEALAPGAFRARWRLPPGRAVDAVATVRLADEPGPAATLAIPRPAGPPARLAIEAARAEAAADDAAPVALRIALADAAGNPVDGTVVLSTTFGELAPAVPVAPGAWTATLRLPSRREGHAEAAVTARSGALEARAAIALRPGAAAAVEVAARGEPIVADGRREARLAVRLLDRYGNGVSGIVPALSGTPAGALAAEPDGAGGWTVRYRPKRARAAGTAVVRVGAAGLQREITIALVEPERRLDLATRLGVAFASGGRAVPIGVEATWWTGALGGRLGVGLDVGTFALSRSDLVGSGAEAIDVSGSARFVPLLAMAAWRGTTPAGPPRWLSAAAGLPWWVSAGAGLAHVSSRVRAEGQPALDAAGVTAALGAAAALGKRFGHGLPFIEARLGWHGDPGFDALGGALTTFTLSIGYRHEAY
jgi:hypothetical protein